MLIAREFIDKSLEAAEAKMVGLAGRELSKDETHLVRYAFSLGMETAQKFQELISVKP